MSYHPLPAGNQQQREWETTTQPITEDPKEQNLRLQCQEAGVAYKPPPSGQEEKPSTMYARWRTLREACEKGAREPGMKGASSSVLKPRGQLRGNGGSRETIDPYKDDDKNSLKEKVAPSALMRKKRLITNAVAFILLGIALIGLWTTGRPPSGLQQQAQQSHSGESSGNTTKLGGVPRPARTLPAPYPIFVASHSKSGTTSMYHYFECGLGPDYVAHRWTTTMRKNGNPELIGRCMELNIADGRPPFEGCGVNKYNQTQTVVWTDTAYIGGDKKCFHPNMDALDALVKAYPRITVVYVVRNATQWYLSANSRRAIFITKWAKHCPQMPNTTDQAVWETFYANHVQSIRDWAARYASQITYVEVPLDSPDTGRLLEQSLGIERKCWKHCLSSFTQEKCKDVQQQQQQKAGQRQGGTRRLLQERGTALSSVQHWAMTGEHVPQDDYKDLSLPDPEVWGTMLELS